jgi:ABC-type polysaccharide/polyol phosphate transport system ATPase subunit
MGEPSIRLEGVSLCYRLAKQRIPSLKEYAIHFMRGSLSYEKLWALRDVDLAVPQGESLGIIGRNGAGKSTLLKVISRVLKPTRGTAAVNGRLAPILELGSGFDFELTGLENVYLNGLLLGHTRREVEEKMGEIIDFSGLGDFIRSPLRNYSSGMQARLGFAVATAWTPDILILDEVLAVGDVTFTEKCEKRLRRFHEEGATVLLVSHSAKAILSNCTRCIWLDDGRIRADGESKEVVNLYLREHGTDPVEHEGGRLPVQA